MGASEHALALALALALTACRSEGERTRAIGSPEPGNADAGRAFEPTAVSGPKRRHGVEIVPAPPLGAVDAIVRDALERTVAARRTLVVYVGASWCEPCRRFHHAAEGGELDSKFPNVTLLDFDLDRDRERLAAAGYASQYIPLFARPSADGRASGKQTEGGVKGDGAVAFIVPRLEEMLSE